MFGELICGPPGSGKTTYCEGKRQFLQVYDPTRPVLMVNLDPANESVFPYPCDVDIRQLVHHATVMEEEGLGPNGSYLFCAEVMEQNIDWLIAEINTVAEKRMGEVLMEHPNAAPRAPYLLMDCPGQVEFYLQSPALQLLFRALQRKLQCSLCTIHLVDACIATRDLSSYVSSCVLALTTMIDHELPHLNVLTKWDLLTSSGEEEAEVFLDAGAFLNEDFDRMWRRQLRRRRHDMRQAENHITGGCPAPPLDPVDVAEDEKIEQIDLARDGGRMYKYTRAMMEVVEGYGMVGYLPLNVQSQEMMLHLTQNIDNAIGNFF